MPTQPSATGDTQLLRAAVLAMSSACSSSPSRPGLFFSHVNDAGFWLVKEYFGMTVGQTLKTGSVMETVISVVRLICVLILDVVA